MEIFQVLVLVGVIIFLGVLIVIDRMRAVEREKDLLKMVMAKHLPDYAQAERILGQTSKDTLKQTKAENDLAMAAAKLEGVKEKGYPVS